MNVLHLFGTILVLALTWKGALSQSSCTTIDNCESCGNPTQTCQNCSLGYILDGTTCTKCPSNCYGSCSLKNGVPACTSCNDAFFENNGTCLACPEDCHECTDKLTCAKCKSGNRLIPTGVSCKACSVSQCDECDGPGKCRECNTGYYLTTGFQCSSCVSFCQKCEDGTKCKECNSGYYIDSEGKCKQCGTACSECTATGCTKCNSNYFLSGGKCYSCSNCASSGNCGGTSGCSQCSTGYFVTADGTCSDCPYNDMDSSSSRCNSCIRKGSNLARFHENGICKYCPSNCQSCTSTSSCGTCQDGFYKNATGSCLACHTDCATCNGPTNGECLTCPKDNQFQNSGTCTACNSTCATCNGATASNCITCEKGRYLKNNECKVCPSETDTLDVDQCTACAGEYVHQDSCIACSPSNCQECTANGATCTKCVSGYYLASGTQCSQCAANCTSCTGANAADCTTCENSGDELISTGCTTKCASNEYRNNNNVCTACNATYTDCDECDSNGCKTCLNNLHLFTNRSGCFDCTVLTTQTDCAAGCYWNTTHCLACDSSCKECSGTASTDCTSCHFQNFYNNECYTCHSSCKTCEGKATTDCLSCESGKSLASDGSCQNCTDSDCLECSQDKDVCTLCANNKTVVNGQCEACPGGSNGALDKDYCNICMFASTSTYGMHRPVTCARCADFCTECTTEGPGKCDTNKCAADYAFVSSSKTCRAADCTNPTTEHECETVCAKGKIKHWISGSSSCVECPANCAACSSATSCSTCADEYVLNANGECVTCFGTEQMCTTCASSTQGRYYQSTGKKCLPCIAYCLECDDGTTCKTGKCVSGRYYDSTTKQCKSCMTGCTECAEENSAEVCITCITGYYKDSNKTCQTCPTANCKKCADTTGQCTECDARYYKDSTNHTCHNCPTGCDECTADKQCTTCIDSTHYIEPASSSDAGQCKGCGIANCAQCRNNTHCKTCATNAFSDGTGTTCTLCSSNCAVCNQTSGCETCSSGYFLQSPNTCTKCSDVLSNCGNCTTGTTCLLCQNDYVNNKYTYLDNGQCKDCPTGCTTCSSLTNCLGCQSTHCLQTQGSSQTCLAHGGKNCKTCKEESNGDITCLSCNNDNALEICEACNDAYCKKCDTKKDTCEECILGYFVSSGSCTKCGTHCTACTDDKTCTTCASTNMVWDATAKECVSCSSGCATCDSTTKCNTCLPNHYPHPVATTGECLVCRKGCSKCTNSTDCSQCLSGYIMASDPVSCRECLSHCEECKVTELNKCVRCQDGYYLAVNDTQCKECGTNCVDCKDGDGTCKACQTGYYLDDNKACQQCTLDGCGICQGRSQCTQCKSEYKLSTDKFTCDKQCYVCTDCEDPNAGHLTSCADDKVCKVSYSGGKASRTCEEKKSGESACVQTNVIPSSETSCDGKTYCCTGNKCNADKCPNSAPAEQRVGLTILLCTLLISLLGRHFF